METSKVERDAYIAEACKAHPTMDPLHATLRFALDEARDAYAQLAYPTDTGDRRRANRDNR